MSAFSKVSQCLGSQPLLCAICARVERVLVQVGIASCLPVAIRLTVCNVHSSVCPLAF